MKPAQTGEAYGRIAAWWGEQMRGADYGIAALKRAIQFSAKDGRALDVGCGCEGRFIRVLTEHGFAPEGLDIAPEMIALIREQHPQLPLYTADICNWVLPHKYELISAWDSIFHLPPEEHQPVLRKLCAGLTEGGILLVTCGGGEEAGEVSGSFGGENFEYSTLGVSAFLRLLMEFGCAIMHVEYDQYPENHVCIIAKKKRARNDLLVD